MSITIVVETGLVVMGANSFVSLDDFKAYCLNLDYDISASPDETIKSALIRAWRYLNGLNWQGDKVNYRQPSCWPRYGVPIVNKTGYLGIGFMSLMERLSYYWPANEVPQKVIDAQCEATYLTLLGEDLQPKLKRGGQIVRKKIDVVETEYAPGASVQTRYFVIENLLQEFLRSGISVETLRA